MSREPLGLECFETLANIKAESEDNANLGDGSRRLRPLQVDEREDQEEQVKRLKATMETVPHIKRKHIEVWVPGRYPFCEPVRLYVNTRKAYKFFYKSFKEPVFYLSNTIPEVHKDEKRGTLICAPISQLQKIKTYSLPQMKKCSVNMKSLANLYCTIKESKFIRCVELPEQVRHPANCLRKLNHLKLKVAALFPPKTQNQKVSQTNGKTPLHRYVANMAHLVEAGKELDENWNRSMNGLSTLPETVTSGEKHCDPFSIECGPEKSDSPNVTEIIDWECHDFGGDSIDPEVKPMPTIFIRKDLFSTPDSVNEKLQNDRNDNQAKDIVHENLCVVKPIVINGKSTISLDRSATVSPKFGDILESSRLNSKEPSKTNSKPMAKTKSLEKAPVEAGPKQLPEVTVKLDLMEESRIKNLSQSPSTEPSENPGQSPKKGKKVIQTVEIPITSVEKKTKKDPQKLKSLGPKSMRITRRNSVQPKIHKYKADMECLYNNIIEGKRSRAGQHTDKRASKAVFVDGALKFKTYAGSENEMERERTQNVQVKVKRMTQLDIWTIKRLLKEYGPSTMGFL